MTRFCFGEKHVFFIFSLIRIYFSTKYYTIHNAPFHYEISHIQIQIFITLYITKPLLCQSDFKKLVFFINTLFFSEHFHFPNEAVSNVVFVVLECSPVILLCSPYSTRNVCSLQTISHKDVCSPCINIW